MKRWHLILLLSACILWIACHNLWVLFGTSTYYFGTAMIIFVSSIILHDINSVTITRIFLFLSMNNLVDELFFDPTKFDINEYLTFIAFIGYTLWKRSKLSNNSSKR